MFRTPEWPSDQSEDEGSRSKVSGRPVPEIVVTKTLDSSLSGSSTKKKKKKKKKSLEQVTSSDLTSTLRKKFDRAVNSPSMTAGLLESSAPSTPATATKRKGVQQVDEEQTSSKHRKLSKSVSSSLSSLTETVTESASQVGSILTKGIKFASETEFFQFVTGKSHKKKKKKKRSTESPDKPQESSRENSSEIKPASSKKKKKKDSDQKLATPERLPDNEKEATPQTKKFDVEKLKKVFRDEKISTSSPTVSKKSDAKSQLKASQFRFLNEKLYSQPGSQSMKMFKQDPEAFRIYHEGYLDQLKKWPKDPLTPIINSIMKYSGNPVVADFGCGEARLARTVSSCCEKVHSFDLIASNDLVTACDMVRTPLESNSVDIAVFCLSLMGTNLRDYIREANRVLKVGGCLKIAEVESRFLEFSVDDFVKAVERCGFKLKWKDLSAFFYLFDFNKVQECRKKAPEFSLKPCFYKKR